MLMLHGEEGSEEKEKNSGEKKDKKKFSSIHMIELTIRIDHLKSIVQLKPFYDSVLQFTS